MFTISDCWLHGVVTGWRWRLRHPRSKGGEKSPSNQFEIVRVDTEPPTPAPEPEVEKPAAAPVKSIKIEVRLQAAGDAPIMKQKNYKV